MLSKATFLVAFLAVAQVTVAAIPGCLLGAIIKYDTPGDIKAVCQSSDYASKIQAVCGDSTTDAIKAFADTCKNAGVTVSTDVKSGSISSTTTGATSGTTGSPNPTGTTNNQGSQTTTGSGAKSTGAAGKLDVSVAALFAGVGLLAAAL